MMKCPRINIIYVIFIVEEFVDLHVIVNDIVCCMNYRLKFACVHLGLFMFRALIRAIIVRHCLKNCWSTEDVYLLLCVFDGGH